MGRITTTCALIGLTALSSAQSTIYVDANATGANDGTTWSDAFNELQDALAASALGDELWVADGTYRPDWDASTQTHTGDRTATFVLRNGVNWFGGFDGGEIGKDQRDPIANPTILDGDLNGDDAPGLVNRTDNSFNVCRNATNGLVSRIEGFLFRGGHADGTGVMARGGAINNNGGRLIFKGCRFLDSFATTEGGGIYNTAGGMLLDVCVVAGNQSRNGGGIFNTNAMSGPDAMVLLGCTVRNNKAITNGGGGNGGGMSNVRGFLIVQGTLVKNNRAETNGGGAYDDSIFGQLLVVNTDFVDNVAGRNGGGFCKVVAGATFQLNVTYAGNRADFGGGMSVQSGSFPFFVDNALFVGNSANTRGGGIDCLTQSPIVLTNCALIANHAPVTGGFHTMAPTGIYNSILWRNTDDTGNAQDAQVIPAANGDIRFSIVEGWDGSLGGSNNNSNDPMLTDPLGPDGDAMTYADGNYRPMSGSPAIDSGANPFAQQRGLFNDQDNNSRFSDDPGTANTGVGLGPIVDRGPYEYDPNP